MKRKTLLIASIAAIAVTIAPPISGFASQPLAVSAAFDPNPPRMGPNTITVSVSDRGNAVTGAKVTIKTDMPAMSMPGPTLTAQDNGDGTYSARTNLTDATAWRFRITAKAGANTGTSTVNIEVKPK